MNTGGENTSINRTTSEAKGVKRRMESERENEAGCIRGADGFRARMHVVSHNVPVLGGSK